jgi:CdiI immunity protein
MSEYPELSQFLGGYFHQDWGLEANDWQGIVEHYRSEQNLEEREAAASEIDRLLLEPMNTDQLGTYLFRELHCYYLPRPDLGGPDVREWLRQVAVALRR